MRRVEATFRASRSRVMRQEQYDQEPDAEDMLGAARRRDPVDIQLGIRRAKAAIGLVLALPGTVYLYQGEELGLPDLDNKCFRRFFCYNDFSNNEYDNDHRSMMD